MKFDNSLIYKVQQSNDIVEVISEHLRLDRKGKEFVGICPFHEDHKPSMYVNPDKQIFKCFACGVGGDVIKFIQMRENLSFPEAIESLAKRAGINFEPVNTKNDSSPNNKIDPKILANINLFAAKFFRSNLQDPKGQYAIDYLKSRNINEQSIKIWGLGLAVDSWDDLTTAAAKSNITEKQLIEAGLAVQRPQSNGSYDKFRNRLMFPIIDSANKVIGFGGRTLADDPAKYMNSPTTELFDKSKCLYGLNNARHEIVKTSTAVVVEGYTDVIMAHQHGCKNVVATLGTSLTEGHARLLRRFARKIVLLFDSDIAGTEAANRALEVCLRQKIDVKITSVPAGKDPCDFILSNGPEAFNQLIESAVDVMDYKWQRTGLILDKSDNLADRKQVIEDYISSIAAAIQGRNIDIITTGQIIYRLQKITGIEERQLRKYFAAKATVKNSHLDIKQNESVKVRNVGPTYIYKAQQHIIEILFASPGLFQSYKDRLKPELFIDSELKEILELIIEVFNETTARNLLQKLASRIESPKISSMLVEMENNGHFYDNREQVLKESVHVLEDFSKDTGLLGGKNLQDGDLIKLMENASKPDMRKTGIVF